MEKEKCPNCNETMEPVSVNCACPECHTMLNHVDYNFDLLAIEFAEWIGSENCDYIPTGVLNEWINSAVKGMQIYITSKELFELFLKTRIA